MNNRPARRALITGIGGQDGIHLGRALLQRGYEVVGFGRRATLIERGDLRELLRGVQLFPADLANPVDIVEAIQRFRPDEVYNLAAQSAPGLSWTQSIETGEVTAMGAHRLFEAVRRFKPDCRVYQASSSEMFGEVLATPQNESTPFNPVNPYAAAKVYAHQMARVYRQSYGIFISCGILFNHESVHRAMRYLTQKVALGAACARLGIADSDALNEEGEPVVGGGRLRLGNLWAARDWGHARDYVEAMWLMLQQDAPDEFVIGTGRLRSVGELCAAAYAHVGLDWREHVVSDPRFVRPAETGATVADASRARERLGWAAVTSFEAMIGEMVDAHLERLRGR